MAEENIISAIKKFLDNYKNQITLYHKDELKSEEKKDINFEYQIYNEYSLQHKLGCYFKDKGYEVFFEKNTKTFLKVEQDYEKDEEKKHEVDLIIIKRDKKKQIAEKYAIELKFPINGQYTQQMEKFIDDMKFMKQLHIAWESENNALLFNTYCLTLVNDHLFYKKAKTDNGHYKEFRSKDIDTKDVIKAESSCSELNENEHIQWHLLKNCQKTKDQIKDQIRYYLINIGEKKSV